MDRWGWDDRLAKERIPGPAVMVDFHYNKKVIFFNYSFRKNIYVDLNVILCKIQIKGHI